MKAQLKGWGEFFQAVSTGVSLLVSADSIVKGLERPRIGANTIPGGLGIKTLSPEIAKALEKSEAALATLYAQELKQIEEQEKIENQVATRKALLQKVEKLAPLIIFAGVGLGLILLLRRG